MKPTSRLLLSFVPLVLAACATRPVSNSEAVQITADRLLDASFVQAAAGTGTVTIKRDRGIGGSACTSRVFVNAKPIVELWPAEKVVLHLPAGDHILSAWPVGMCGGGMSEVKATVKPGAESNFRIGYGSNGDFSINATAF